MDIGLLDSDRQLTEAGEELLGIALSNNFTALEFLEATKKLTNFKIGSAWRKYFFRSTVRSLVIREGNGVLYTVPIQQSHTEAYCVFVTTNLNTNVISDFRARRYMEYYNSDGTEYITGMKILPIQTSELKALLKSGVEYPRIYQILDKAYNSSGAPKEWYEKNIVIETGDYKC